VRAMPVAAIWLQLPVTASLHDLQDRQIRTAAVAHPGLQAISVSVAVALLILPSVQPDRLCVIVAKCFGLPRSQPKAV
jgi:hypothetical protein